MVERENTQVSSFQTQAGTNHHNAQTDQLFIYENPNIDHETDFLSNTSLKLGLDDISNAVLLPSTINLDFLSKNDLCQGVHDELALSNIGQTSESECFSSMCDQYLEATSPISIWGDPFDLDTNDVKMDDVFQVDKADLIQSPTLAELNSSNQSLIDPLDNFDVLYSETESDSSIPSPPPCTNLNFKSLSDKNLGVVNVENKSDSEQLNEQNLSITKPAFKDNKLDSLRKVSLQHKINAETKLQTVPNISLDEKRSKKPMLLKTLCSTSKRKPFDQKELSTINSPKKFTDTKHLYALNPKDIQKSPIDIKTLDTDDESDLNGASSSDNESDEELKSNFDSNKVASIFEKKNSRYFWQYNIQSKGPKMKLSEEDYSSYKFRDITDPVFSSNCFIKGVKHAGKARRGDGNDLTPNPKKLYNIGIEIQKLSDTIDSLTPVNDLPSSARTKSRKEKNKLASRACRLKKKAQHEANKLKLFGLQQEQANIQKIIAEAKKLIKKRLLENSKKSTLSLQEALKTIQLKTRTIIVAGRSADFVNEVLRRVASGDSTGGLSIPVSHKN